MKKPDTSVAAEGRVDRALIEKAVDALLKHHAQQAAEKNKSSLLGTDLSVQLQFGLEVPPAQVNHKPIKLNIPHALWNHQQTDEKEIDVLEEPEVCLIVKEDAKPQIKELIAQFPKELCFVKKVLGLESLRKKHATYAQRRELLHKYNVFMADDRILPMLTTALGRDFLKAKQQPSPVKINPLNNLPLRLLTALRSTYLILAKGTCVTVKAGTTAMSRDALVDNLVALATSTPEKLPRQWANVRSMAIKTSKSTALPIYNRTPEQLMEIAKLAKLEPFFGESKKRTKTEDAKSQEADDNKAKRRKIIKEKSPLVRALQKQKEKSPLTNEAGKEAKKTESPKHKKREMETKDETEFSAKKKKVTKDDKAGEASTRKEEVPKTTKEDAKKLKKDKNSKSPKDEVKEKKETKADLDHVKKSAEEIKETKYSSSQAKEEQEPKKKAKETPKDTSFLPVKKFQGSKQGYVFQKGPKGVGYYKDAPPKVDPMALEAIRRMGNQKSNKSGGRNGGKGNGRGGGRGGGRRR
ncbi:ribosome biogenesis protein UTP30 [Fistulifera solaris]|jgi:ribosome biogenesis protein UTP30|uniref:Ribosome biogenesis protein UTP30 n=1 Tax=Fistulifera solaris TaxID=1519565 RepID=A0A1Z5KI90_FISSO|nr:ribosome biogenesis protein UTP30 [Fistulifera solaris]|eukprot:GAX25937.1 ribosome biogenesis protein UTP30 [Fistulifera solaris]